MNTVTMNMDHGETPGRRKKSLEVSALGKAAGYDSAAVANALGRWLISRLVFVA